MRLRTLLLVLVLVAFLVFGGVKMALDLSKLRLSDAQKRWADALSAAFEAHGLDPAWGVALGMTETVLKAATNLVGADGARGGSYGPTQISQRTARAFGYLGEMETLNGDPSLAADLTAQMVVQGFANRTIAGVAQNLYYGKPSTVEDMCAVWNAGRAANDPELPASTSSYIQKTLGYLAQVGTMKA